MLLELPQRFDSFIFPRSHLFSRLAVSSIPLKRVFGEIRDRKLFSTKTIRFFVESRTERIAHALIINCVGKIIIGSFSKFVFEIYYRFVKNFITARSYSFLFFGKLLFNCYIYIKYIFERLDQKWHKESWQGCNRLIVAIHIL